VDNLALGRSIGRQAPAIVVTDGRLAQACCGGTSADPRNDDDLLVATARGDADAFGVFYRRHAAEVLAFLARRTGSYELAADLAGETFAGALLSCKRYLPGSAPALAWLLGIARNKLRESARRGRVDQRARERLGIAPLALDDGDLARIEELAGQGERALNLLEGLPVGQREAVRAHVLEDRGYRESASELGVQSRSSASTSAAG
jgi:RNA polymerase sigma factor (sigma-70 family)